jgi:hypothetical protein
VARGFKHVDVNDWRMTSEPDSVVIPEVACIDRIAQGRHDLPSTPGIVRLGAMLTGIRRRRDPR